MENELTSIQWLISKIEQELSQSTTSTYKCTDGTIIKTDVGYVEDWWNEYKQHLIQQLRMKLLREDKISNNDVNQES